MAKRPEQKPNKQKTYTDGRSGKLIETIRTPGGEAALFKVPSMFPGEHLYRVEFGGRDYYFATQQEAHRAVKELAVKPGRKAA
jgi:hypothetical protein